MVDYRMFPGFQAGFEKVEKVEKKFNKSSKMTTPLRVVKQSWKGGGGRKT